jgi:type II secretory pathway pseudopilin PulG
VILLMMLIALALMIIALSVAVPKMTQQIRRERENEMIHRGVQYARAVKRFYKKFGRYPTTIEQLENTNNIRFLRKRYKDPMTADGKWRFVRYGEVQLGQQGSMTPGAGSGGSLPGVVGGALGQTSGDTSQQPNSGSTGSGQPQQGQPGSLFGQPAGGQSAGGMFGSSGTSGVFGGGPILGVASSSEKKGIHEFDKKSQYRQWLFVYDPNQDRGGLISGPYNPKAFMGTPNQVGTPAGQVGQPGGSMLGNPPPGQLGVNPQPQPQQQQTPQ